MQKINHNSVDYDLGIFDRIKHKFSVGGSIEVTADINFSVHCYTEEWQSGVVILDHNNFKREFCPIRHAYSTSCIEKIDDWLKRECIQSTDSKGNKNWILVEDANGQKGKVAFDMKKHKFDANSVWIRIKTIHPYDKTSPPDLTVTPQTTFKKMTKAVGIYGNTPKLEVPKQKKTLTLSKSS